MRDEWALMHCNLWWLKLDVEMFRYNQYGNNGIQFADQHSPLHLNHVTTCERILHPCRRIVDSIVSSM